MIIIWGGGDDFEALFTFLHERYFQRAVFGPIYLAERKAKMFTTSMTAVGFEGGPDHSFLPVQQPP